MAGYGKGHLKCLDDHHPLKSKLVEIIFKDDYSLNLEIFSCPSCHKYYGKNKMERDIKKAALYETKKMIHYENKKLKDIEKVKII